MHTDEELISGCVKGDRAKQKVLYERFCKKMLVICLRYSKGLQEAEDILQESFIKVFNNIHTFRKECPLEQWIKRIVINTALKHNRSKLYMYPAIDIEDIDHTIDENVALAEYNFNELLAMIQQLAPRYQVVFNLFAIEGYQHKEIAEMLGITEGTSKSQYARARMLLQQMLLDQKKINYEIRLSNRGLK